MMVNDTSISDEVFKKAKEDIDTLLQNRKLSASERTQLEIQSYFLLVMSADHQKLSNLYPWYKEQIRKETERRDFWKRFQWVIIPMAISGMLVFLGQAIYFWIAVVPTLMAGH